MNRKSISLGAYRVILSERNYKNANTFYLYIKNGAIEGRYSAQTITDLINCFSLQKNQYPFSVSMKILIVLKELM